VIFHIGNQQESCIILIDVIFTHISRTWQTFEHCEIINAHFYSGQQFMQRAGKRVRPASRHIIVRPSHSIMQSLLVTCHVMPASSHAYSMAYLFTHSLVTTLNASTKIAFIENTMATSLHYDRYFIEITKLSTVKHFSKWVNEAIYVYLQGACSRNRLQHKKTCTSMVCICICLYLLITELLIRVFNDVSTNKRI